MPRDMEEFRQELLEEARADELHDHALRNDYDYFLKHYSDLIAEFNDSYKKLKKAHEDTSREFDIYIYEVLI